jgi:hypothetical protein
MSISKIGGATGSDNWELISSVTPTIATAAVNFTGLSVYRKFLVIAIDVGGQGAGEALSLRLNNDSGSNKYFHSTNWATSIPITTNATPTQGAVTIENCDNSGVKYIYKNFNTAPTLTDALYLASAVISQVNILSTATFSGTGTLSLYGVK